MMEGNEEKDSTLMGCRNDWAAGQTTNNPNNSGGK
jgi:hypothetical protein